MFPVKNAVVKLRCSNKAEPDLVPERNPEQFLARRVTQTVVQSFPLESSQRPQL
jgi:hypothetical protein